MSEMSPYFLSELTRNKRAMQTFAQLSPIDKQKLSERVAHIRSRENLRLLVLSMDDTESAGEYPQYD